MTIDTCALCDNMLAHSTIRDGENGFCCPGCHTVFTILSTRNQLANYQDSPLFKQALRSGLISNPALLEQIRRNRAENSDVEKEKLHLEVSEMWCPACAEIIRLILLQEKGIYNCVVDYATDMASVEFLPRHISKEKIFALISSLGYTVAPLDGGKKAVSFSLYLRFAIAAFCSLNVMMFAYPIYAAYFDYDDQGYGMLFAWISLFTSIPVITYCAYPIIRRFMAALQVGLYGMETLVVIGSSAAFGLSVYNLIHGSSKVYFDSMTVIIAFVLLGKIIEAKAKFSAKDAIVRLSLSLPRRGRKQFDDGAQQFVPIKEIQVDDLVVAFTGERIVADGVVIKGEATCDESLMTGESLPILKKEGVNLLSGSIVQHGSLVYRVTVLPQQSALHRIVDMVQSEVTHKTAYVRAADTIVLWFVPLVLCIAAGTILGTWIFSISDPGYSVGETAFFRALSVLLISCPCAIGIAAPLAEAHVLNEMARIGAIVRNRGCLALLGRETVFAFDKTGTITQGAFTVISGLEAMTPSQRAMLKGLASQSTHPIARAIAQAIPEQPAQVDRVEEFAGLGLRGKEALFLGSAKFLLQFGVPFMEDPSANLYFVINNSSFPILLGDKVRSDATSTLGKLSSVQTMLLSGDAPNVVMKVANECGFSSWKAACTPLQKREVIEALRKQGHIVTMIGDGINDAPALTAAHVGISVVSATDISIQVSDILLTTDNLSILPKIRSIAANGRRIINQNLFWAFCYNVIGIGLAAFGMLSPIFAAIAMVLSSLMVIVNAQRIR